MPASFCPRKADWRAWPALRAEGQVRYASSRVLRGGSFNNNDDNCRAAYRNNNRPTNCNDNNGFRLCCSGKTPTV